MGRGRAGVWSEGLSGVKCLCCCPTHPALYFSNFRVTLNCDSTNSSSRKSNQSPSGCSDSDVTGSFIIKEGDVFHCWQKNETSKMLLLIMMALPSQTTEKIHEEQGVAFSGANNPEE